MKKKISLILLTILLSVFMLAACGDTGSVNSDEQEPEDVTTQEDISNEEPDTDIDADTDEDADADTDEDADAESSSEIKITVDAPEGWKEVESANYSVLVDYESETASFTVIETYAPEGTDTPMALAQYEMDESQAVLAEAEISDYVETVISGMDAVYVAMNVPAGDDVVQCNDYVYFFRGEKAYRITGTYFSNDEQAVDDVASMIQTIEVE